MCVIPASVLLMLLNCLCALCSGQQQRVNLARAAYDNSSIILLDDPLSAVDAHVGEHIMRHLILGFLANRTRVLVTHQLAAAVPHCDFVLVMNTQGDMLGFAPPSELPRLLSPHMNREDGAICGRTRSMSANSIRSRGASDATTAVSTLQSQCAPDGTISRGISGSAVRNRSDSASSVTSSGDTISATEHYADMGAFCRALAVISAASASNSNSNSNSSGGASDVDLKSNSKALVVEPASTDVDSHAAGASAAGRLIENETKSTGEVTWSVYLFYFSMCGGVLVFSIWVALSFSIAASNTLQSYALGSWIEEMKVSSVSEHSSSSSSSGSAFYYYIGAVGLGVVSALLRQCFQLIISLHGGHAIHNTMARSVISAKSRWFDTTPLGRILNRFSQDISSIDNNVMRSFAEFVDCGTGTINVIVVIAIFKPILLVILLPVLIYSFSVVAQYLHVSRDIKRLESVSQSPLYAVFGETLQGLIVVRAFRKQGHIWERLNKCLDDLNRCHLYLWICNRWLGFRISVSIVVLL